MKDRWRDDVSGYPDMMRNILWFTVKTHAGEYIKAEMPMAWFRTLFTGEPLDVANSDPKQPMTFVDALRTRGIDLNNDV